MFRYGMILLVCLLFTGYIVKISAGRVDCKSTLLKRCKCSDTVNNLVVNCERQNNKSPITTGELKDLEFPVDTSRLNLKNNNLGRILIADFQRLIELTSLDLSNNNIHEIQHGSFQANTLLKNIILSGNRLKCNCYTLSFRYWATANNVRVVGANCRKKNILEDIFELPASSFGKCKLTTIKIPVVTVQPPAPGANQCFKCVSKFRNSECLRMTSHATCTTSQICSSTVQLRPETKSILMNKGCLEKAACQNRKQRKCSEIDWKKLTSYKSCTDCCTESLCNRNDTLRKFLKPVSLSVKLNTTLKVSCESASDKLEKWTNTALIGKAFTLNGIEIECKSGKIRTQRIGLNISGDVFVRAQPNDIKNQIRAIIRESGLSNEIVDGEISIDLYNEVEECMAEVTVSKVRGTIKWSKSLPGQVQYQPCPFQKEVPGAPMDDDPALASRKCVLKGKKIDWMKPNYAQCGFDNPRLNKLAKLLDTPVTKENVESVLEDLNNLTTDATTMTVDDISLTSQTVDNIFAVPEAFLKASQNATTNSLVSIFGHLISANTTSLELAQSENDGANRIIEQIDQLTNKVTVEGIEVLLATNENMALKVISSESIGNAGYSYQGQHGASGVSLPKSLFKNNAQAEKVKFVQYKNPAIFTVLGKLSKSEFPLNSEVLAVSIGLGEKKGLTEPIKLNFKKTNVSDNEQICVYWNFTANGGKGNWSTEGCTTKSSVSGFTTCECDHLTNFALLMNVHGGGASMTSPEHMRILSIISLIGCCLSLLALFATLLTYALFEKLRKDVPSQLLICLCLALFCVNLVFVFGSHIQKDDIPCKVVGVLLHYFLLCSFTWMLIEAFYMYLALVKVFQPYFSKLLLKFCIIGWGVPLIIVAITLGIDVNNYGPQGDPQNPFCWLSRIPFYGSFLGPICLILLLNMLSFIMVVKQIHAMAKRSKITRREKSSVSTQLKGAVGVMLLLGLTWIFGLLAISGVSALVFSYIFVVLNTLQGLFIFVFYCILKRDAQIAWARKCGFPDIKESSSSSSKGTVSSRLSAFSTKKRKNTASSIDIHNINDKKRPSQDSYISAEKPTKSPEQMISADNNENRKSVADPHDIQLEYNTKL